MMYGFGDDRQPQAQSVQLMEDYVLDYVYLLLHQATMASEERQRRARRAGEVRVKDQDLLFALRKNRKQSERAREVLEVWKEIEEARGQDNLKSRGEQAFS